MTSPVQLSDLDLAVAADDADLALIRKSNTTDYKVTVQVLRNINIPGLPPLGSSPGPTDLLIVSQGGINSQCNFGSIGLTVGTKLWFYQNTVPVSSMFWQIVPNTGDTLLAVRGGGTYGTGGTSGGTWQQSNATLTTDQIPSHTHRILKTKETTGSSNNLGPCRGKHTENDDFTPYRYATSEPTGGGQPHNHGNAWRPLSSVGIICQKVL